MAASLPSSATPAVDEAGRLTSPWIGFFTSLIRSAGAVEAVSLSGSPFTYRASSDGHALIQGGTVSQVRIIRGQVSTVVPFAGFVPIARGDSLVITYSAPPTLTFFPS